MPLTDDELLRREQALRQEADAVVADLRLVQQLSELGDPVRTGSSALGLMVWRDIDLTVVCANTLGDGGVIALAGWLALQPSVRQVTYRDDTGGWNVEPEKYPDGLYIQVRYQLVPGQEWHLDIWFVTEPDRMPDLSHLRTIPPQLDPLRRLAILRIKDAWRCKPEYGSKVTGYDIYTAVLDRGVRTPEEFEAGLPSG